MRNICLKCDLQCSCLDSWDNGKSDCECSKFINNKDKDNYDSQDRTRISW